jgi:hypothetical protein
MGRPIESREATMRQTRTTERIKLYAVFGLALILVLVVCVRFIHKKGPSAEGPGPGEVSASPLDLSRWEFEPSGEDQPKAVVAQDAVRNPARDIFSPCGELARAASQPLGIDEPGLAASLTLRGVVAGGDKPVALINDQFVRTGDRIGKHSVLRIGEKDVLLDSGIQTYRLKIRKDHETKE